MTEERTRIMEETVAHITKEMLQLPALMRGNLLEDAHYLAGGDVDIHSDILAVAYGLLVAGSLVHEDEDRIGASIVRGAFPMFRNFIHKLVKQHKDTKTTIDNLTAALAMLKEEA